MRLPKIGSWVRVYWLDADSSDGWQDADEKTELVHEISTGSFLGLTPDGKARIAQTVSLVVGSGQLHKKDSELRVGLGMIQCIELLPQPLRDDELPPPPVPRGVLIVASR